MSTRDKACERRGQIIFLRVSMSPEQCTGFFDVASEWTKMWNEMAIEKEGYNLQETEFQGSIQKNKHQCIVSGLPMVLFLFLSAHLCLCILFSQLACPSCKSGPVLPSNTQMGLTGLAGFEYENFESNFGAPFTCCFPTRLIWACSV